MDGSTASLIAIPIVVTLALAAWLLPGGLRRRPPAVEARHRGEQARRTPPRQIIRSIPPNLAPPTWPTLARTPARKSPPS